jgi:hypothetical protein
MLPLTSRHQQHEFLGAIVVYKYAYMCESIRAWIVSTLAPEIVLVVVFIVAIRQRQRHTWVVVLSSLDKSNPNPSQSIPDTTKITNVRSQMDMMESAIGELEMDLRQQIKESYDNSEGNSPPQKNLH